MHKMVLLYTEAYKDNHVHIVNNFFSKFPGRVLLQFSYSNLCGHLIPDTQQATGKQINLESYRLI